VNIIRKIRNWLYGRTAAVQFPADRYPEVPYGTRDGMVTPVAFDPPSNVNITETGTGWPEKTITDVTPETAQEVPDAAVAE
jgi:hypothetical protein